MIYNPIVTMILYSTVIFGTRQIIIRHNISQDILNKGVYGILFTQTQNAYLYNLVFSYALYIPVFVRIPTAYKNFYFPYSAMFYVVYGAALQPCSKHTEMGLSPSKTIDVICFIESPFKIMKNAFNFILKVLFVLKIFKFFYESLVMQEKELDLKDKVNCKINGVTTWLPNNCNTHIDQYLTK